MQTTLVPREEGKNFGHFHFWQRHAGAAPLLPSAGGVQGLSRDASEAEAERARVGDAWTGK